MFFFFTAALQLPATSLQFLHSRIRLNEAHSYLAVCVDGGAQQFPGSSPPVHAQHPQDLQEAQAPQGRGQHITLVTHRHHRHRGNQHKDV